MSWLPLVGPSPTPWICWSCWWLDNLLSDHRRFQYVKCGWAAGESYWHISIHICLVLLRAWLPSARPPTAPFSCRCCWWLDTEMTGHQQLQYEKWLKCRRGWNIWCISQLAEILAPGRCWWWPGSLSRAITGGGDLLMLLMAWHPFISPLVASIDALDSWCSAMILALGRCFWWPGSL